MSLADLHCRSDLYLVDEYCLERKDSLDRAPCETIDRSKQSCNMKEGVVCNFHRRVPLEVINYS